MADTQDLVVDLKIRDNLSVGLANAKKNVEGFGDAASRSAAQAEGAFSTAANNIRAKFASLGPDIQKGIGLGLGLGATQLVARGVTELTGFLKDSVQAFADEEAGIKRLSIALTENAPTWDRNSDAVERTIQARQKLAFSDDELRDSLTSLTGATGDVGKAFQLQSLAMDLARFKGESLAAASDELVKVQAGSFRALKGLGIELDANATSTEALAAIQKVVGGQAEAFGDSTSAAMIKAGIAVDNLQEKIGEGLAPAIGKAADALANFIDKDLSAFGDNSVREINTIQDAWDEFISRLSGTAAPVGRIKEVEKALNDSAVVARYAAQYAFYHGQALNDEAEAAEKLSSALTTGLPHLDDLAVGLKGYTITVLGATGQTDKFSDAILKGSNAAITGAEGYGLLADVFDRLRGTGGKPFVAPPTQIPGLDSNGKTGLPPGGVTLPESFLSDLDQDERNRRKKQQEDDDAAAKRLADAKAAASDYANLLATKLDAALKKEKDTATVLFDSLHARHLQAIADTEKLAEKQHDTALQAISDALKVRLAANAAPVDAAERRQQQIELSRQRRDLGESLQAAQQSGDPEAIRRASEALQSFNAAQRIAALKVDQATKDLAAQTEAAAAQKAADDKLAAAKLAQAAGLEEENKRFKKQTDDFDRALAALKIRDKGATPGKIAKDISDLEGKFGITRDAAGHSHIDDPLVVAIKTIKIPAPTVNLYPTFYSPPIFLNGRLIASAIASNLSPAATPGVRTGTLTPKAAG